MSDWVMFLRSQTTKDAYKTFKQELEDERAYIRRKNILDKVKEFKEQEKKKEEEAKAVEEQEKKKEEEAKALEERRKRIDEEEKRKMKKQEARLKNPKTKNDIHRAMVRKNRVEPTPEPTPEPKTKFTDYNPKDKSIIISKDYPLRVSKLYLDEPDPKKPLTEEELKAIGYNLELQDNLYRRQDAIVNHFRLIDSLDEYGTAGKRYRKWLKNRIIAFATYPFKTEEEEYQAIGKYGRGMFNEVEMEKSLDKDQLKEMRQFAREYGAFDY